MRRHWSLWLTGALAALGALFVDNVGVRAQEHGEGGGESPGVAEITGETAQICTSSVETLTKEVRILFSEYDTTINCFAFGEEGRLEHGVVSLFHNGTSVGRYNLTCGSNIVKAERLMNQSASPVEHTACLECAPTSEDDICPDPCPSECEKCAFINSVNRVLCTECRMYRLLNIYRPRSTPTAEEIERERERNEEEQECNDNPTLDPGNLPMSNPEDPMNFHCVSECPDQGNHSAPTEKEGKRTCFACGLEYCVECEENEEPGGHDECITCMTNTVLFEGECYACPRATIARTAILQEAEEQAEERQNQLRQIELAVSLPVVCFLVIVFFLAMSVYAHHRYPHISHKGHKRHRRKKPDMFSREASSPTPSAEDELPPLAESGIWRSRPTVRFR